MSGKRRFKGGGRRFIRLWTNVKRSQAYHKLDVYGRCALFELLDRYTGCNNGIIGLGCRELSEALNCSRDRAAKALRDLDDSGLAIPLTAGTWRGKRATEWRISFYRCDKTGELPILNWTPRSQSACKDAKVRVEGRKAFLSPSGRTQEPKISIGEGPVSPFGRTHIDIYQGGTDSLMSSEAASEHPPTEGPKEASQDFDPPQVAHDPPILSLAKLTRAR